jgi:hypothetical protein
VPSSFSSSVRTASALVEWLEDQLADLVAGSLDGLSQVDRRRGPDRHEVHLGLESHARHADRIADAGVLVDRVLLRNRMQQLAILRNRLRAGDLVGAIHVTLVDLVAGDRHDALARHRLHVLPRDADVQLVHLGARHPFGVLHGLPDRASRLLDVGDDAASHTGGLRLSHPEDLQRRVPRHVTFDFGDDGRGLGGADVQRGDETFRVHWRRAMICPEYRRSSSITRAARRRRSASTN